MYVCTYCTEWHCSNKLLSYKGCIRIDRSEIVKKKNFWYEKLNEYELYIFLWRYCIKLFRCKLYAYWTIVTHYCLIEHFLDSCLILSKLYRLKYRPSEHEECFDGKLFKLIERKFSVCMWKYSELQTQIFGVSGGGKVRIGVSGMWLS